MNDRKTKKAGPLTSFLGGLLCIFFSIFDGFPTYQLAKESQTWPKTQGEILRSEIKVETTKDKTHYFVDINYSYTVNNQKFTSSNIIVGTSVDSSNSGEAYEYRNKYPVKTIVDVYYSPKEPNVSALEPGLTKSHYHLLIFSLLFLLVGLLVILQSIFKLAILSTALVVLLREFVKGKDNQIGSPAKLNPSLRKNTLQKNGDVGGEINLDEEMNRLNKVSRSSKSTHEEPWRHHWMIEGKGKKYGPYSFEQIKRLYDSGKIKGVHNCSPINGSGSFKIADIIEKKAS